MTDESPVRDTAEAIKGIVEAVPIYQDMLQPAAQEIGQALRTVTQLIHVALAPVSAAVWGYERISEFVTTRLAEKLRNVPPEQIISPPAQIAGPALEAMRFMGDTPDVRELFATLLATAMVSERVHLAHPSFVEIIKQLSPDEARILKQLTEKNVYPVIDVYTNFGSDEPGEEAIFEITYSNECLVGLDAGCTRPDLVESYLLNLSRLGLVVISARPIYDFHYEDLEQHLAERLGWIRVEDGFLEGKTTYHSRVHRKHLTLNEFGTNFVEACIEGASRKRFEAILCRTPVDPV